MEGCVSRHGDQKAVRKLVAQRQARNLHAIAVGGGHPNCLHQSMVVRRPRLAFSRENLQAVGRLVGNDQVSRGIGGLINADALLVLGKAGGTKQRQFRVGVGSIRIGGVFSDPVAFIRVVTIPQRIIDRDRFNFLDSAPDAEFPHLGRLDFA